ncbi:MAG: hypothetical protein KGZ39_07675 [Simkania sp.]|nr:hypothetical protein [Simkania sp.]
MNSLLKQVKKVYSSELFMHVLGLHRDSNCWKIALISLQDKGERIELLHTLRQEDKPLEILETILSKKPYHIASALSADQVILRSLSLDIRGWDHILKVLPFQIEDLIPFPKEHTLLLPFLEQETAQGSTVKLVATQHSFLKEMLSAIHTLGMDPHHMTTAVHALKRWARFVAPQERSLFLLYVSQKSSFGALLLDEDIKIFKTFSYERNGESLRIKTFLESQLEGSTSLPWLIAGESELLNEEFPSLPVTKQLQEYAIPIGICLEVLAKDGKSIEWCQNTLEAPSRRKKNRKTLFTTIALLMGCTILFGPLGHRLLAKHETSLFTRAKTALATLHIPTKTLDLQGALERLVMRQDELSQEAQFGPYSPSLSLALSSISRATLSLDPHQPPTIRTLNYYVSASKQPTLDIEWACPSKDSLRSIKTALNRLQTPKIAVCRENETLLFTSFVME